MSNNVSVQVLNLLCVHRKAGHDHVVPVATRVLSIETGTSLELAGYQPSLKFSERGFVLGLGRERDSRTPDILFLLHVAAHTCV